ncbi:hypothetical protein BJX99DRAFT_241110 [Aspergillus californicus]
MGYIIYGTLLALFFLVCSSLFTVISRLGYWVGRILGRGSMFQAYIFFVLYILSSLILGSSIATVTISYKIRS